MPKRIREPADPDSGPIAAFGFQLRTLRQQAQRTYTSIAETSYFSKSAIHTVDQGHQLPTEATLKAFVTACGDDPRPWLQHRDQLAADLAASRQETPDKRSPRDQGLPAPDSATVNTAAEFNDGLKRLREWCGLTYRQIADASPPGARVAPSTLHGAVTRATLPRRTLVVGFLHAIGLPEPDCDAWLHAWQAIEDGKPVPPPRKPALPTVRDVLGTPPADAIASHPWGEHPPARLVIRSSPIPEHPELGGLAPIRIPDNDVVPAYLLPSEEIRDWTFQDGTWKSIENHQPAGMTSRARFPGWVLAIAIAILCSTATLIAIAATQ
ncbi:helix-turn-helix domain-containing protein [Actinoplanes subglobosus]|uniref:Helix-turn-helix domain-containing protein n=1 Tax=Actinoplanes subglobosus TaxID=1547892 RepID=A0ABV8IU49_9ACTN